MAGATSVAIDKDLVSAQITDHNPLPTGYDSEDTQITAHCPLPIASFSLGQPAPVLDAGAADAASAGEYALASPLQTNAVTQTDWISDDYLAYLRQSVKR